MSDLHKVLAKLSDEDIVCLRRSIYEFQPVDPKTGNEEFDLLLLQYGQKLVRQVAQSICYPRPRTKTLVSGHVIPETDNAYGYTEGYLAFYLENSLFATMKERIKPTKIGQDVVYEYNKFVKFIAQLPKDIVILKGDMC
jgi:hypothetical protein